MIPDYYSIISQKTDPTRGSVSVGAGDQIRTDYLVITNDVLYLLSYTSVPNALYYSELWSVFQPLFRINYYIFAMNAFSLRAKAYFLRGF